MLTLTTEEMAAVAGVCRQIRLPARLPGYFREFIVTRLMQARAPLAGKVLALTDTALVRVFSYVYHCQGTARESWPPAFTAFH